MLKVNLTPCYILHHHKYGETSLILDVLSRDYGRVNLIAKGAKKNKKQQDIAFDLYQKYLISWVLKTELGTLTSIELARSLLMIKPDKILSGFYMNEIVLRLLHKHEAHPELFDAYERALNKLVEGEHEEKILRYFEMALLKSLGYGLVLDYDVKTGEPIDGDNEYSYEYDHGPSVQSAQTKMSCTISGQTLLELNNEQLSNSKQIHEAKKLLRSVLSRYLGEKPLASRDLYNAYIKTRNTA